MESETDRRNQEEARQPYGPPCPFCGGHGFCPNHFLGWTEDGRTVEVPKPVVQRCGPATVLETDRVVTTGISARVYRP